MYICLLQQQNLLRAPSFNRVRDSTYKVKETLYQQTPHLKRGRTCNSLLLLSHLHLRHVPLLYRGLCVHSLLTDSCLPPEASRTSLSATYLDWLPQEGTRSLWDPGLLLGRLGSEKMPFTSTFTSTGPCLYSLN